jgi:hypothetical protein
MPVRFGQEVQALPRDGELTPMEDRGPVLKELSERLSELGEFL